MNKRIKKLKGILLENSHFKYRVDKFGSSVLDDNTIKLPLNIRKATAIKKALEDMPVYIQDDELIIGGRTIFNLPEYHTPIEIEESKCSPNIVNHPFFDAVFNDSIDEVGDKVSDTNPANYQKIVKNGLLWYWKFADKKLKTQKLTSEQISFYKAVKIVIEGAQKHIKRYVDLIEAKITENNISADRKKELSEMRRNIEHIVENPPDNFYQGVQLIYFIFIMLWVEAITLVPLMRIDQILYPLFKNDIENKLIDKDKGLEIIECFFIKINFDVDKPNNRFAWLKGDTGATITLGGTKFGDMNQNGENNLTFIFIKALKELGLIDPHVHIRLNEGSSEKMWDEVVDLVSYGRGIPIIDWDNNIIKGLGGVGIYSEQDMVNYSGTGCWEIIIEGKTSYRQTTNVNLLLPLEWLLFSGKNPIYDDPDNTPPIDGRHPGLDMGDLDNYDTFNKFIEAYKKELKYYVLMIVTKVIKTKLAYNPLISTFVDDCLESGKDIKDGGARYRETDLQACSVANIADSLYSIKKLVYDDMELTLKELSEILLDNYRGFEDLRLRIKNKFPKYGNGIADVDNIAKEILEFFSEETTSYTNGWGGPFRARIAGASSYVDTIKLVGATPDGRRIGDYASINSSPQIGSEKNGPTGIIRSVTNIDSSKFAGGFILDLKFKKNIFETMENRGKVKDLLRAYFKSGGLQVQINVVDRDTLKNAQKHPEEYKDLIVRVWGFSAYFIELPKEFQDHIIERTEIDV